MDIPSLILILVVDVAASWAVFRIYNRAGFEGGWMILISCLFMPIFTLFCLCYIAKSRWPALDTVGKSSPTNEPTPEDRSTLA